MPGSLGVIGERRTAVESEANSELLKEAARLAALKRLQVLDSMEEQAYDDIVRLAAEMCEVPIALISLVDERRQWFKARVGLQAQQTPREHAFCAHTLPTGLPLVVRDALADERFCDNPLVTGDPNIRFYAGAPLLTTDGHVMGTVCVIDTVPRDISADQLGQLQLLAQQVMTMLEGHRIGHWLDDALEAGGVGLFTLDVATQTIFPTASCCAVFGLPSRLSFPAAAFEACVHPDDKAATSSSASRSDGSADLIAEYRIVRSDNGEVRHVERRAQLRRSPDGLPSHFNGSVRDVTRERQAEALAAERALELRRYADSRDFIIALVKSQRSAESPDAIVRLTAQALGARLKAQGVGLYRVLASGEIELDGWNESAKAGLDSAMSSDRFGAVLESGAVLERLSDGRPLVFCDSRRDLDGTLVGLARLGILSGIVIPMHSVHGGETGVYVDCREPRVWREEDVALVREVAEFGWLAVERCEALIQLKDRIGNQNTELALGRASLQIAKANNEAAEAQLRQLQKLEAVGLLTGGIAHDFNNMLAVIIGALNLAQGKLHRGERNLQPHMDSALEAARRAASLTRRLLAFSRQQPLAPQPLDVNRVVADMTELLGRTLGETIRLEAIQSAGLWTTKADQSQLEAVLINLAANARDAMQRGGKLTIETSNSDIPASFAEEYGIPCGHYVKITVTDTGTGIDPDLLDKIFDPFFTTKEVGQGTGLGLSQAYGFARQSGGHLRVYSELGSGSAFSLYLPRHLETSTATLQAQPAPRIARPGCAQEIVMVVEDEARLRAITVEALTEAGYTVVEASNGAEALSLFKAGQRADLLFTDVVMPEMSGSELAERVVAQYPQVKLLFTTGYTRNALVHNGVLNFGTNFLPKPFSIDDLLHKVAEALDAGT